MATDKLHVLRVIYVVSPKGGVLQVYAFYLHVFAVGDIDESRTLLIFVGALSVPFPAQPELLMVSQSVAVYGSFS